MARIIELACKAADIRKRYAKIHTTVFRFSLRRTSLFSVFHRPVDYAGQIRELDALENEAKEIRLAMKELETDDLTKRYRVEIKSTLSRYLHALAMALEQLKGICTSLQKEHRQVEGYLDYSQIRFKRDTVAYDDSVQKYKRWGTRLNKFFTDL